MTGVEGGSCRNFGTPPRHREHAPCPEAWAAVHALDPVRVMSQATSPSPNVTGNA